MDKLLTTHRHYFIFGLMALLFGLLILMAKSSLVSEYHLLPTAISIDLLISSPVIYWLLIRKTNIPKITILPVLMLGYLTGSFLLPTEHRGLVPYFSTWILPLVELTAVAFIILKIRKARKLFRHQDGTDFYSQLQATCQEIFPGRVAALVSTEIAVVYYGFVSWKKYKLKQGEFSYHRESGSVALFYAIIFIVLIETVALHFLIAGWSTLAAWILTALSLYTALQLFGFTRSLSKRPIVITENHLHLRNGIMGESRIRLSEIAKIIISSKDETEGTHLSMLSNLENHNIVLHLNRDVEVRQLYGITKKSDTLLFHVDDPSAFVAAVNEALISQS